MKKMWFLWRKRHETWVDHEGNICWHIRDKKDNLIDGVEAVEERRRRKQEEKAGGQRLGERVHLNDR